MQVISATWSTVSAREPARALRELADQQRCLVHLRVLAPSVVGEAHGVGADVDRVVERRARAGAEHDSLACGLLELAGDLAGADQLVAGDLAQRAAVAGDVAVVGHAQDEVRAADRACTGDAEEIGGGLAASGRGERRDQRGSEALHAATTAPPRRGSPAPVSTPVAGSR